MNRIIRVGLTAIIINTASVSIAFGFIQQIDPETSKIIVFSGTVVFAMAVGIMLLLIARRSSNSFRYRGISSKGQSSKSAVSEQVDNLLESGKRPKEVFNALLSSFNEKLEQKVDSVKNELSQKYGRIIEEKEQAVIAINKKYNQVSVEKQQTESIVRSIAEGLVLVNEKGEVILMNPAAEKLLGVKKEDKIGKPILEGLKDEQLITLAKESQAGEKEIVVNSKNLDTKKILKSSGAVIEDENGKTVGMVSVLSDVTKQKQLEQMKSDFLSSVSHELRTPIVAMEKSLDVMFDPSAGSLTENQKQFLDIAKRNMKRLDYLINDLLDLSKLEAKKMQMKFELSSIEEVINDTCQTFKTWAETKGIAILKKIQSGLPRINFDQERIIQVLNNIVGNAIKFTPNNGSVTIEVKLQNNKKVVEISVSDTGIGIAKEDIPKLFSKFQQVGNKNPSDISGTGLGLAIAKEIVKLHKGDIWVESEKDKGAKFTFTLPLTINQPNTGG